MMSQAVPHKFFCLLISLSHGVPFLAKKAVLLKWEQGIAVANPKTLVVRCYTLIVELGGKLDMHADSTLY